PQPPPMTPRGSTEPARPTPGRAFYCAVLSRASCRVPFCCEPSLLMLLCGRQSRRGSGLMLKTAPPGPDLLSGLPGHLATDLFPGAKPVRLKADEVLFLASDPGDGCYRIDEGLLEVSMMSRTGTERILAFMGPGSIV